MNAWHFLQQEQDSSWPPTSPMLRIVFQADEAQLQNVITPALAALSERLQRLKASVLQGFTLRNVRAGAQGAAGVEFVEIHNDADWVFSSSLDQVRARTCAIT